MLQLDNSDLNHRQKSIVKYVVKTGKSQVNTLAQHFEVSEQTIRNDLDKLFKLKLIQRVHGGATIKDYSEIDEKYLNSGIRNLNYSARKQIFHEEKIRIGLKVAEIVPKNSSLFINIGTTTESVAEALKSKAGLLVVTNSLNIANTMRDGNAGETMIASGIVRPEDGGIVGAATIDFIEQFRMDFAVIGISAIDEDGILLDFDFREVQVTKSIIKYARSVILVADHSKFERKAPVIMGDLSKIDYLVTDRLPGENIIQACKENKVELFVPGLSSEFMEKQEVFEGANQDIH